VPLVEPVDLIVGAEYEDRLNIYSRTSATVGLSMRF
jgi:hypothetical protein